MSEDEIAKLVASGIERALAAKTAGAAGIGAAEVYSVIGAMVTAFGGALTILIKLYARGKDALRQLYESQVESEKQRNKDLLNTIKEIKEGRHEAIEKMACQAQNLQAELIKSKEEHMSELRSTPPLVATALQHSANSQLKSAEANEQLAIAFQSATHEIAGMRSELVRIEEILRERR